MPARKTQGLTYGLLLGVALAAFGPLEILSSRAFAAENPVPLISQALVPDAVAPGGEGFTLTVNGTGFVSGAVVNWNHSSLPTTFVKDSQVTASVPAPDIAAASTASVTVVNPSPGGCTSNVMFFEVTSAISSIALGAPPAFGAGTNPSSVAVGDFNGDGKLDLAVANEGGNNVSILLGNGNGTFKAAVNYGTGTAPGAVAVGDFNGDGKLDLVVGGVESDNVSVVSVLLGNGDGTFQAAVNYGAGAGQTSVAVGDFNGDGRLDLAFPASLLLQTPLALLSSTSLNFGTELVGTTRAPNQVTLSNPSGLALTISGIAVTGTNVADFSQTNTCGTGLAIGANCTITVTFKPAQTGPRTASVTTTDNAAGSPQTIGLSGTGLASGPNATPAPTSLTFATQLVGTSSSAQPVTLTNYGKMALSIASIAASGDFGQTNTCGSRLAAEASCTISVTFRPTQRGPRTGTLSITDNAAGSPQTVSLTGTGTMVEFSPANLSFGSVKRASSKTLTTTLSNTGSTALSISGITITGSTTFSQTNTCGASVAAGGSCTITATFRPLGIGSFSGDVSVSDSGGGSPQQAPLSGSAY